MATREDIGLVGLLVLRGGEHFFPSARLSCGGGRAVRFGRAWLSSGFRLGVGKEQHVPPLLLQSLHSTAQLLNAPRLGTELLVQPVHPDAKCRLGLTLVPTGT